MNSRIKLLLSIPKSFMFCLHYFSVSDAIKLPVLIAYDTKIGRLSRKSKIKLECPIKRGLFRIGFHSLESVSDGRKSYFTMENDATLVLRGKSKFAEGTSLTIEGVLTIGDNVVANNNFSLSCHTQVEIGNNTLFGWEVKILDSDNHVIVDSAGNEKESEAPVTIGSNVWVGAYSHFLKGSGVSDNCVVSYRSLVTKKFSKEGIIIGGVPARELSEISHWKW